ncbi:dehydrogenase [Rubrobacter tropicus]|uniref:Dehydrogenase n=1 Tax=Rubrobacter tropicus TaxID=2653851 RepID=A0A6G8QCU5_9ACTN|nr:Gfo/Idh/MocA family oxidoreductase [Rubrobacter tropicus]QIN84334.1 dehydrogenase [Rubrobacter tropicus]
MRIAVLGAGRIGSFRARVLGGLPEVDEIFIGNRTGGRAEELAREVGGTAGTIDEAIDSEPDAVFVSLATGLHAEALHRCIDAGLPIFCEKPIALTLRDTAAVIEHAERGGNVLQIAFQRRLDPDYLRAYQAVRDGTLGTLYSLRITAHDAEPAPEEFIELSGGTYRDLHIHDFDLARWLTGLDVDQVYATGSVRGFDRYAKFGDVDNAAILMTMSDGLPVIVTGTRHNARGHDFRLEVFGSEDSLSVGDNSLSQPRPVEPDEVPPTRGPYRDFMERFGDSLREETKAFIGVMKGERENPSPPAAAMEALRVAVACEVSRTEGRPVKVAEIEGDPPDLT